MSDAIKISRLIAPIQDSIDFIKETHRTNIEYLRDWQGRLLACRHSKDKERIRGYLEGCRGARKHARIAVSMIEEREAKILRLLNVQGNNEAVFDKEKGLAVGTPHSQLATHWLAARAEFITAASDPNAPPCIQPTEWLALGAIRSMYWLALGQGDTALAREIGEWWHDCAPLHGQGEVIQ